MVRFWAKAAATGAALTMTLASPASARMQPSLVSDVLSAVDVCWTSMFVGGFDYEVFEAAGFVPLPSSKPSDVPSFRSWTLRERPTVLISFLGEKGEPRCGLSLNSIAEREFEAMVAGVVRSHGEPIESMSDDSRMVWAGGGKVLIVGREGPLGAQDVTFSINAFVE